MTLVIDKRFHLLARLKKGSTIGSDIHALVNCRNEVVDDLHHELRILAQVEALLRCRVDVPVEVLERLVLTCLDNVEDEVESNPALAPHFCVLVRPKLHDFKMVQTCLLL